MASWKAVECLPALQQQMASTRDSSRATSQPSAAKTAPAAALKALLPPQLLVRRGEAPLTGALLKLGEPLRALSGRSPGGVAGWEEDTPTDRRMRMLSGCAKWCSDR